MEWSDMKFFGTYGLYPVESKWTTELNVSLILHFKVDASSPLNLNDTIDYQDVYRLVADQMTKPHGLLENLALILVQELKSFDSRILGGRICIRKKPQLGGPLESVGIALDF